MFLTVKWMLNLYSFSHNLYFCLCFSSKKALFLTCMQGYAKRSILIGCSRVRIFLECIWLVLLPMCTLTTTIIGLQYIHWQKLFHFAESFIKAISLHLLYIQLSPTSHAIFPLWLFLKVHVSLPPPPTPSPALRCLRKTWHDVLCQHCAKLNIYFITFESCFNFVHFRPFVPLGCTHFLHLPTKTDHLDNLTVLSLYSIEKELSNDTKSFGIG
jgi:hypothetical protein